MDLRKCILKDEIRTRDLRSVWTNKNIFPLPALETNEQQ